MSGKEDATTPAKEKSQDQIIRDLKLEKEALEMKLKSLDRVEVVQESDEVMMVVEQLKKEVEELRNRPTQIQTIDGKKPKYQVKDPKDLLPDGEGVTFTARYVTKVIPGYLDSRGIEVIAPYKIIIMKYAASDQRMDGKEEEIINFCSYTTRWKKEIEFLRNHPEFGVTFSDNMNKVAGQNAKDYQFRVRASHEVASMSPESVLSYAGQYKIKGAAEMSFKQLKPLIMDAMVLDYVTQEKTLNEEIQNRIFEQADKHK